MHSYKCVTCGAECKASSRSANKCPKCLGFKPTKESKKLKEQIAKLLKGA